MRRDRQGDRAALPGGRGQRRDLRHQRRRPRCRGQGPVRLRHRPRHPGRRPVHGRRGPDGRRDRGGSARSTCSSATRASPASCRSSSSPRKSGTRCSTTNVKGMFTLVKHAVPHMIRQGGGTIVTLGSEMGIVAVPESPAYNASKGAVIMFTKSIAVDLIRHNIRVNASARGSPAPRCCRPRWTTASTPSDRGRAGVLGADHAGRRPAGDRPGRAVPGQRGQLVRGRQLPGARRRLHRALTAMVMIQRPTGPATSPRTSGWPTSPVSWTSCGRPGRCPGPRWPAGSGFPCPPRTGWSPTWPTSSWCEEEEPEADSPRGWAARRSSTGSATTPACWPAWTSATKPPRMAVTTLSGRVITAQADDFGPAWPGSLPGALAGQITEHGGQLTGHDAGQLAGAGVGVAAVGGPGRGPASPADCTPSGTAFRWARNWRRCWAARWRWHRMTTSPPSPRAATPGRSPARRRCWSRDRPGYRRGHDCSGRADAGAHRSVRPDRGLAGDQPGRAGRDTLGRAAWSAGGLVGQYQRRGGSREVRDGAALAAAARDGDQRRREVFDWAALTIADLVGRLQPLCDPEAVVIGGGLARAYDLLEPGPGRAAARAAEGRPQRARRAGRRGRGGAGRPALT